MIQRSRHIRPSRALLGCTLALAWLLASCAAPGASTPSATSVPAQATFFNPLNEMNGPDPWLQYYEGNYYLTATQAGDIRMWKSPTLAGLASATPTVVWTDNEPTRCCNMWAPEFHLLDGPNGKRWYMYYTAGTDGTLDLQHMYVLESSGTDPLGPYTFKAQIFDPANNGWAIDASVLTMRDGKLYLLFSSWEGDNQNMFIAPMSNPWTISGKRVLISSPTYPWERSVGNVNEGPVALQRGEDTFIIYSASACWGPDYKLGMLRYTGGDPLDAKSWQKQDKPVFERSDANGVYAPGHNGFFTSPDGKENWIVYHANAVASDGCGNTRTTRVQPFTWNADGTPNFGTPLSLDTPIPVPSGETGTAPEPTPQYYALVGRDGEQCLNAKDGALAMAACDQSNNQQWSIYYLANGFYRLANRAGGALTVAGGPDAKADGATVGLESWSQAQNQQWKFATAENGWVTIQARHSEKSLAACQGITQAAAQKASTCQQFRLQPLGAVEVRSLNSDKPLTVAQSGNAIVLRSNADPAAQRWAWVHQSDGYYRLEQNGACLARTTTLLERQPCGTAAEQQWRFDPMNDGTVRIVARETGKVIDVVNCLMADGTAVQQWTWLNNACQRFRLMPG